MFLKGGLLVASFVGIDLRSTMDIDSALREAIINTSRRRSREMLLENRGNVMNDIAESPIMEAAWNNFKRQSYFVGDLSWREVIEGCQLLIEYVLPE